MSQSLTHPSHAADGSGSVLFREVLAVALSFTVAGLALGYGLGHLPLLQPDEGRNAEIGREMKESGGWLIPTYNGADYLDKPAFYFKAVAFSLAAFGDSEGAARTPSAVFGLALLLVTYFFCRRVVTFRCAALAVMVIATTPLYLAYSRLVIFDIALTFFTCAAIFAGYLAEEKTGVSRLNWYLLGAAAAGFGTLVKGPVGFIVPTLVLGVFHRIEGRRGAMKRLLAPLNLVVFFGVVLPWFIGVTLAHPDFPYYGIIEESFHRFTTGSFRRTKPVYFYPLIIAATFFPWSILLPESIVLAWRQRARWSRLDRLCIVWSIVVVVFFSLSRSKMPGYILSVAVAVGILIARVFDRVWDTTGDRFSQLIVRATAGLVVVSMCAAAVVAYGDFHPVEFGRLLRLNAGEMGELMRHAPHTIGLFVLLAVFAGLACHRRSVRLGLAAFVLPAIVLLMFDGGLFEFFSNRRSVRDLAARVSSSSASAEVVCLECLPHGLPFYLGRTVTVVTSDGAPLSSNYVLFDLKTNPRWPSTLVPLSGRGQWLDSRKRPVYLLAKTESKSVLDQIALERGGRVVQLTDGYCGLLVPAPGGV